MVHQKGDFSADKRLLWIAALAVGIGGVCSLIAVILVKMIGLFTNLFFFHRLSTDFTSPAQNSLGWWAVLVPVAGGLLIGLMARYGSDRIRGHGIPEALEAILFNKSKMSLKVALLKPVSSALSIGTGGPFGAEGPIIMTGGAFGSLIAQAFHLTAAERKTLLVAGACAGMAAIFASPVAAVMLSVELLLFEWKPRSLVPVAVACAVAAVLRPYLLGAGPLFPVPPHDSMAATGLFFALVAGIASGFFSTLLTAGVYAFEDFFLNLPFHWMWFPAIGGLVVGIGGHFEPRALGVGYDVIGDFLKGQFIPKTAFSLVLVKSLIWSVALGSGTSGGVLAPLLILGGGLGVLESAVFPVGSSTLWPLISMAAILGGVMRVPFTAVIFALELTRDVNALLPLLIASVSAYTFTVLVMKRSILTEKVARRGFHVLREYSVDLLEKNHVEDVMTRKVRAIPSQFPAEKIMARYFHGPLKHQGYPVLDKDKRLLGIITRGDLAKNAVHGKKAHDLMSRKLVVAHPHETCRSAATRMARHRIGRLLVVDERKPHKLVGIVTRSDLIKPNVGHFEEEEIREKLIELEFPRLPGTGGKK